MAGAANSINEGTTGICGFTGTAFTGTPVTQYNTLVGGATSSALVNISPGTSGQVLTSNGAAANPSYQSPVGFTPIAFAAYLSSTQTNATGDGTIFTPIYDTVLSNVGSGYNNATGVFTTPATGTYMFSYITCYGNSGVSTAFISAFVSGAPENYNFRADQSSAANVFSGVLISNGTATVHLTAGTTVQMSVAAYGSTKTVSITGGTLSTYATTSVFSGFRVA